MYSCNVLFVYYYRDMTAPAPAMHACACVWGSEACTATHSLIPRIHETQRTHLPYDYVTYELDHTIVDRYKQPEVAHM